MIRATVSSATTESGFTLIEVLVATLVLGIGLVGIAALQAVSLKNNQSTLMRSQASALAYDLADRMRSNVSSARAGEYDPDAAAITAGCNTVTGCTPSELALHDLAEWNAAISALLPSGQGFVCIDSTSNDGSGAVDPQCDGLGTQFAVKLWWDDDRDGAVTVSATNNERLTIAFQL